MDKSITFILLFIVFSGVAYYLWQENEDSLIPMQQQVAIPVETVAPVAAMMEEEENRYPVLEQVLPVTEEHEAEPTIEVVAEVERLPALDESDEVMQAVFTRFYDPVKLAELFIFREFVRHIVVSVDNMTTKKLPRRFVFTQSPGTSFMVEKTADENEFILDEKNFERYRRFINFADAVDIQQLVSVYVRYYPLFQEAYAELGYPGRYFNARLIEVIDHLRQTPDVKGPIKLLRPKVFYKFADPVLEDLSAGQKLLIRIGYENAVLVKTRLKGLRQILTTPGPGQ